MSNIKAGGPAFPAAHFDLADNERGMTLRDYFAAKAMQALLVDRNKASYLEHMPKICYQWADAMLKAREQ